MVSGALSSEEGGQNTVQKVILYTKSETDRKDFKGAQKEYKKELGLGITLKPVNGLRIRRQFLKD